MEILLTGVCGFVGSSLALGLLDADSTVTLFGVDNFSRPGSEQNRALLKTRGVTLFHGDIRNASDLENLPAVDWVLDAAANPSVLAGVDGTASSRQLIEHNLLGTINLLEMCKRWRAGFVLLSTSRVYSIAPLSALPVEVYDEAYRPATGAMLPDGLSPAGVSERFATTPPVSLYGSTKLASEVLALEYAETFGFPAWINRCGVLAGAGQFGRADQGIFAYWINSYLRRRPLGYIGFDGHGHQVRDCLHPRDLVPLLLRQMREPARPVERVQNVSGGREQSMSLAQLSRWCGERFGVLAVAHNSRPRPFDIPWMVLDSSLARRQWDWQPRTTMAAMLEEIAAHAEEHPAWLELSAPFTSAADLFG